MHPINIGLLGLGTVGCGTVSVLTKNAKKITERIQRPFKISHALVHNLDKKRALITDDIILTTDPHTLTQNPDIDIICELIGGIEPARELILNAIEHGKHIVTANKALIALHGDEILQAAKVKGVMIGFEAAVAGGIPIIKTINESLSSNHIQSIIGIINGTSNFILTAMRDKGYDFTVALQEAQNLGFAEADPSFDINGTDAAHKLAILATIGFHIPFQYSKIYTEGIDNITLEDIHNADELGYGIKHIGIARNHQNNIELRVHPALIPKSHLFSHVDNVKNAVLVEGNAVGPTMYYGAGAGAMPTASAVVADLIDIAHNMQYSNLLLKIQQGFDNKPILTMDEIKTSYYLRMHTIDKPGVLAGITHIFGQLNIGIESIIQKSHAKDVDYVSIVLLTQPIQEKYMNHAICDIEKISSIQGKISRIRIESLD